jgi:hypothetical protein
MNYFFEPESKISKQSRFKLNTLTFQDVMRMYSRFLTPSQLVVLLFIMDRTVGWGKRWEIITHQHFLVGIPSPEEDHDYYAGPLKMSLNTLKSALKFLIANRLVCQKKGRLWGKQLTSYSLSENFFADLPKDNERDNE